MSENEKLVYVNGINGLTGSYAVEPQPVEALARHAFGKVRDVSKEDRKDLKSRVSTDETFAPPPWTDDQDLSEVGWGVIFAENADPDMNAKIREALSELLEFRKGQAGPLYREFFPPENGFRASDNKRRFLNRYGAGEGVTNPQLMPYYLLIVGDPASIDFTFQYELDLAYAVGRIHFPTLDDYASYARSVVAGESGKVRLPRRASFFSMLNPDDPSTESSNKHLTRPVFNNLRALDKLKKPGSEWTLDFIGDGQATKEGLKRLMGGPDTPALLFTSSHGMMYPSPDPRGLPEQIPLTGALMCEKWPGRNFSGEVMRDWLFTAEDIADDASLLGLISFNFACYGAGSPYQDDYFRASLVERRPVAPHAFLARLPQRLLSHPRGGALAMIGHIDRAWGNSYLLGGVEQNDTIQAVLYELLQGKRVGSAVEHLNRRYAEIGTQLTNKFEKGQLTDDIALVSEWTTFNDSRGYIVIGDPAARLPLADSGLADEPRAVIEPPVHRAGSVPLVLVPSKLPEDTAALLAENMGVDVPVPFGIGAARAEKSSGDAASPQPSAAVEEFQVVAVDQPDDAINKVVGGGINAFNLQKTGTNDWKSLCMVLKAPGGEIAGGLIGETYWDWFYISLLFVKEELRGRGYGGQLLARAEEEARARGARNAYLDTFSFQSPGFYRKRGYEEFGALDDFPPGHKRHFLKKRL